MSKKRARGKQQIPETNCNQNNTMVASNSNVSKKRNHPQQLNSIPALRIQDDFLHRGYILRKVFRKDGPPLRVEFDGLPSHAFRFCNVKDSGRSHRACQEKQRALKRQKTSKPTNVEVQITPPGSASFKQGIGKGLMTVWKLANQEGNLVKKHGIGKGLMTIQQLTNPGVQNLPTCAKNHNKTHRKKNPRKQQPVARRLAKKVPEKKSSVRNKKVRSEQVDMQRQICRETCEIALVRGGSEEDQSRYDMLADDEELELRELQETSNPLACAHCAVNRLHGCSLCKDLLAKFPSNLVGMKQPVHMQPWDSSPELAKKLFKVFHFVSTYAVIIGIQSFTLDELAQAFIDKDSVLLGKLNIALMKLLLTGVKKELDSGFAYHFCKNWKYRALLESVEREETILKLWMRSLNPLTCIEILSQVLTAAGLGSKHDKIPKEPLNKEAALMASYGLRSGTLKGELFSILSLQGNIGMKISELASQSSIIGLKLATTTDKVEQLINSMLSSDITLFEKISSSTYRLRSSSFLKNEEEDQSDLEDYGSVDDDPSDLEDGSGESNASKPRQKNLSKNTDNTSHVNSEIDESQPGEMWLLGLMEGEYSDLNIEEKLEALLALIDLVKAGLTIRMEEPASCAIPNVYHIGSGAKVKRSTAIQRRTNCSQMINSCESDSIQDMRPVDSSRIVSVIHEKAATDIEATDDLHPMQSIFLGSDRRYNQYWLFVGPCNMSDPGHKRVYFESSEDGHWEVIETEEALTSLILALDQRGRRECHLLSSLKKREAVLREAMSSIGSDVTKVGQPTVSNESERSISRDDSSSAVSDVDNILGLSYNQQDDLTSTSAAVTPVSNREQAKQNWCRLQQFDAWSWNSFHSALNSAKHGKRSFLDSLARCESCHDLYWRDEKHCRICHTTFELDIDLEERYAIHAATCRNDSDSNMYPKHRVFSSQLQSLKAAAYTLESSMPEGAMVGAWTKSTHNIWVKRLRRTSTVVQLLQILADFVGSINKRWVYESETGHDFGYDLDDIISSFSSLPQTSSAVALWLVKLDFFIAPHLRKGEHEKNVKNNRRSSHHRPNRSRLMLPEAGRSCIFGH